MSKAARQRVAARVLSVAVSVLGLAVLLPALMGLFTLGGREMPWGLFVLGAVALLAPMGLISFIAMGLVGRALIGVGAVATLALAMLLVRLGIQAAMIPLAVAIFGGFYLGTGVLMVRLARQGEHYDR